MADDNIIRLEADATKAVAEFERLKAAATSTGEQISGGFDEASASADRFLNAVATGGKGAERAMALTAIQIDKLEKEIIQLKAQGKPTAALEAGVESLRGKLALGTAQLGKFRAAAADAADATRKATQRAGEFSGSITDVTGTLKLMSPALGDAIDKYAILAAKAYALSQAAALVTGGLRKLTDGTEKSADGLAKTETATRAYIVATDELASSVAKFDIKGVAANVLNLAGVWRAHAEGLYDNVTAFGALTDAKEAYDLAGEIKAQRNIVQGHKDTLAALDAKAAGIVREIALQKQSGGVQEYLRAEVKKTLDAYAAAHEPVDAALASQARSLGIVSTAQENASKSAKDLEKSSVEAAKRRAEAEEKAAERIRKANEDTLKQIREHYKSVFDEIEALEAKLATGAEVSNKHIEDLRKTIKDLSSQPVLDQNQQNALDKAREELAGARIQRTPLPGANDPAAAEFAANIDLLQEKQRQLNILNDQGQKVYDALGGEVQSTENVLNDYHDAVAETIRATDSAAGATDALAESVAGAEVRIETLADGTKLITNTVDEMGGVFAKVGGILVEDFGDGELVIRNTGSAAEYLSDAATDAGKSLGKAADAAGDIGKESKKGADTAKEGLDNLKAGAEEVIPLLDIIASKLDIIAQKASAVEL